ncbi:Alpha/beta hydrolase [Paramixta manurensis]|uniref:Alpha/beta hydrolase n=1 Tax=Paramixta manurensis TaxID=2740817 RepID=A0A6M8UEJ2_9GAMM|nr:Alpha/beta hydrolase [Erwiniaceae bacterium PD-1]
MNSFVKVVTAATLVLTLAGCSHSLTLTPGQQAAISPQAAAFIKKTSYPIIPSFIPISDQQIIDGRKKFNASEAPIEADLIKKYALHTQRTTIAGVPVLVITPTHVAAGLEDVAAINIHGGGFVMGDASDRSALMVAGTLGVTVYSIDYDMAPEAKFPVAIDQSLSVYKQLVTRFRPERMIGISSSSGGEIMLAMLLKAQRQHLPMIKAQVLFSPASDITGNGDSAVANDGRDVAPLGLTLRIANQFYLNGIDARKPEVSPLYDTYPSSFPASVIVSGTRDLLLSDAVRLFWKLKAVDVTSELLIAEGGTHGFHWQYQTPESIATMKAADRFLRQQLQ